jgi:hypothetical protein
VEAATDQPVELGQRDGVLLADQVQQLDVALRSLDAAVVASPPPDQTLTPGRRLHGEAATDLSPERLAELGRAIFTSSQP